MASDNRCRFKSSILIILLLNVFIVGLFSFSMLFVFTEERDYLTYHLHPDFCLPCADLSLHPEDPHDGIVFHHNRTVCCSKNQTSLPTLVDKYVSQWYKEYLYKESPEYHGCKDVVENDHNGPINNPTKEFFKIHGYTDRRLNGTKHRRVHWDHNTKISSANIGYAHEHGHITINKKGMYQIYSQVVASHNTRPSTIHGAPNMFLHTITMRQDRENAEEKTIIGSTISQCETDAVGTHEVSHIGTVYQLREGDKVFVRVSYPEDIVPNPRMNFFGVHMI